ncbi:hypothetical protein BH11PSE3_BH11PSE3_12330 [soil metagenome]
MFFLAGHLCFSARCLAIVVSLLHFVPLSTRADDAAARLDEGLRTAFDHVQVDDQQHDTERSMGPAAYVWWRYDRQQAKNELTVKFVDGLVNHSVAVLRPGEIQIPVPIGEGMTPGQVQAVLGPPKSICNYYSFREGAEAEVCFSGGNATSKKFITPLMERLRVTAHQGDPFICRPFVFFSPRSAVLSDSGKETLQAFLRKCPRASASDTKSIVLQGHTDAVEVPDGSIALSQARAEAVRTYLVSLGILATNVSVMARGDANPLVHTKDQEPQNRRVEVEVP